MTQEKKHIELPWNIHSDWGDTCGISNTNEKNVCSLLDKEEAKFIVRACNNFYPLLEACKAIEANLEYKRKLAIDRGVSIAYSPIEEKLRQAIKAAEEELVKKN